MAMTESRLVFDRLHQASPRLLGKSAAIMVVTVDYLGGEEIATIEVASRGDLDNGQVTVERMLESAKECLENYYEEYRTDPVFQSRKKLDQ